MIKTGIRLWLSLALFLIVTQSWAGVYQYRDENGTLCFTDDQTQVPRDQLDPTRVLETVNPEIPPEAETYIPPAPDESPPSAADPYTWDGRFRDAAAGLEQRQARLDQIYQALEKEKNRLQAVSIRGLSRDEKMALKNQVTALNQKIQQYHQKCSRLESDIKAFYSRYK